MQQPTTKVINETLAQLEAAERDPDHARSIARQAVAEWRSDAAKGQLPTTNIIDTGAPLLRPDEVLGHEHHNKRLGRK